MPFSSFGRVKSGILAMYGQNLWVLSYLRQQTSEIPQASSPRGALETYHHHEIEVKNKSYQTKERRFHFEFLELLTHRKRESLLCVVVCGFCETQPSKLKIL